MMTFARDGSVARAVPRTGRDRSLGFPPKTSGPRAESSTACVRTSQRAVCFAHICKVRIRAVSRTFGHRDGRFTAFAYRGCHGRRVSHSVTSHRKWADASGTVWLAARPPGLFEFVRLQRQLGEL